MATIQTYTKPAQFFLLPDPRMSGTARLVSVTSQAGQQVSTIAPAATNDGDLIPFLDGVPTDPAVEHRFRLQQSGGIYSATWAWRDLEGGSNYYGQDDLRRLNLVRPPWSTDEFEGYGLAACYSRPFNRTLVFRRDSSTPSTATTATVEIAYRAYEPGADAPSWSSTSFTPDRWGSGYESCGLSVVELADYDLRAFVQWRDNTSHDFDVYGSSDGGLTWSKVHANVLRQFGVSRNQYRHARAAVSGDHVRLCMVDLDTSNRIRTIVSSDRGATWDEVALIADSAYDNGNAYDNYQFDIIGLGAGPTGSGGFLLHLHTGGTSRSKLFYASGDEDWQELTDFGTTAFMGGSASHAGRAVAFTHDEARVYAWSWMVNTAGTPYDQRGWIVRSCRIDQVLDPDQWSSYVGVNEYSIPNSQGSARFEPANVYACWTGERMLFVHAMVDKDDSGNIEAFTTCYCVHGWTQQSVSRARGNLGIVSSIPIYTDEWFATFGRPAGSGAHVSSDTQWAEAQTGTPAFDWSTTRTRIVCGTSVDSAYWYIDKGSSPTDKWADASLHEWESRCAGSPGMGDLRAGVRVRAIGTNGEKVNVTVRYRSEGGVTRASLWDEVAGTCLFETGDLTHDTDYYAWRLGIDTGANTRVRLWYKTLSGQTWSESGTVTALDTTGGFTTQRAAFGIESATDAGVTIQARCFRVAGTSSYGHARAWSADDDLVGRVCAPNPAYIGAGTWARWGGGGGFRMDTYDEQRQYTEGAEALFVDSPAFAWRSTSVATQQFVWDAGAGSAFVHSGIAAFAGRVKELLVQYSHDAFITTIAAETLSFVGYGTAALSQVHHDTVTLSAGSTIAAQYHVGELEGCYLQQTIPSPAAFVVRKHLPGDVVQTDYGTDLASAGISANGVGYRVISPCAVHPYAQTVIARYMRWTLAFGSRIAGPGLSNSFEIGSVVVGTTHPIRVPLAWAHDDTEEPNVTVNQTPGGLRWSHREGDPRRALVGRLTGDVSAYRAEFRAMLRTLTDYSERPCVLVLDDQELTRRSRVVYGRVTGSTQLENEGWYQDAAGTWRRAGDLSLRFEEEV